MTFNLKSILRMGLQGSAMAVALGAAAASAQTLEDRIAALEAKAATKSSVSTATGVDLTFYGFARADAYKDFDYDLGSNSGGFGGMIANHGATAAKRSYGAHAYQSRLGVRGSYEGAKFQVEGDFYGANGAFRLRHAWVDFNDWMIGQNWSNFNADGNAATNFDFGGVPGGPGNRTVQVRYTHDMGNGLALSGSIEDQGSAAKATPLVTAALRYTVDTHRFHVNVGARDLKHTNNEKVSTYGVNLSYNGTPWEGGRIGAVYTHGKGISSILNFSGNVGANFSVPGKGTYDIDSAGRAVGVKGFALSAGHKFNDQFEIAAAHGLYDYDTFAGATAASTDKISSTMLTLTYRPVEKVTLGLEYIQMDTKNFAGKKFNADRVLAVAQFNF